VADGGKVYFSARKKVSERSEFFFPRKNKPSPQPGTKTSRLGPNKPATTQARKEPKQMTPNQDTHSKLIGYLLWIFGFLGSHRFYYGKPITGTIWFFTLGLLFIGWFIDLFLIPAMDREADRRFRDGEVSYSIGWILLTFLGVFGIHRMYMGKWITGVIYLLTGGLFLIGVLYDFWTLNNQISERNQEVRFG
jgi:TM2 domain-containing membrane protein YozV